MTHPYDEPTKWDGQRKVVGPMTDEQSEKIRSLMTKVPSYYREPLEAMLTTRTHRGQIINEGTLNHDGADAMITILQIIVREAGQ